MQFLWGKLWASYWFMSKNIPHRKHLIESEVDSLIKKLHGGSMLTHGELVEDNLILQNIGIKESKWLLIHEHCIQNTNQVDQGLGNHILCVSILNRSDEETKKNIFLPLLSATNWISQHEKLRP